MSTGYSQVLFTHSYDGEKNYGEIGPIRSYLPDYKRLRARSWQSFLESDVTQIILSKWITWVIGEGLTLQSEPAKKALQIFGIEVDTNEFSERVEALYGIYSESRESDHSRMQSKNEIEAEVLKNAIVGGDVLVILRYEDETPTIQVVDGAHVETPLGKGSDIMPMVLPNGNRIENGIELSPSNEHVAYYVKKAGTVGEYERVLARSPQTGLIMAFLVYGNKYRLDNHRGIPLISVVLETIKKLERYKEATVGSAEERQKIAYVIEHQLGSTGENPLIGQLAKVAGFDQGNDFPTDSMGEQLANKIAATTNKQTFNLPIQAQMKTLEGKGELYFKDFYTINFDIVCACIGIPPNVAMGKYDANYSASRAAIKDWEHTLNVNRKRFANQFEKQVYSFWLHIQIFKAIIQAPGFLKAWFTRQWMVVEAYTKARFAGPNVPHIDPFKEVQAVRAKLGKAGEALPLTTLEAATRELNGGGSDENMEQFATELEMADGLGIKAPEQVPSIPPNNDGNE